MLLAKCLWHFITASCENQGIDKNFYWYVVGEVLTLLPRKANPTQQNRIFLLNRSLEKSGLFFIARADQDLHLEAAQQS